jgi:hypothetical protein
MATPNLALGTDVWNLDQLRLPAENVGTLETWRRPPRHRPGDPFIKGPVSHAWIASACRLPGVGLRVAMACRFLCCRFRRENRWGVDAIAKGLRISARSARRGFRVAELAKLLAVEREPGCKLSVFVLDLPEAGPYVGRCMVRYLGAGGSRPADSPVSHSNWHGSVGSWRVGRDRPISSCRWRVGTSSASRGSRPPGVWMSWSGTGWSMSIGRRVGHRLLQYLTSTRRTVDAATRVS